ncbi:MAG: hypothetical protein CSA62_02805 [Planctomycetota bacterium]|nr:MAG: hypothetical protein CSA62_02805 [Planctomycetota bacterium]
MDRPVLYFFPFSEPESIELHGFARGVLSRRLPDFLCLCLNERRDGSAELLEIRETDEQGVPTGRWVTLTGEMEPEEAMGVIDEDERDAALVIGAIKAVPPVNLQGEPLPDGGCSELQLDLSIVQGEPALVTRQFSLQIPIEDVARAWTGLAAEIAKEMQLPLPSNNWRHYETEEPQAFFALLLGLEGAALMDPELIAERQPKDLLQPFLDCLHLDPDYSLALRCFYIALQDGLEQLALDMDEFNQLLDQALDLKPGDREVATVVGEFYAASGDNERAEAWLQLAVQGEDPPGAALETLGILLANRGEGAEARQLWLDGVNADGHPDFFAHLARLSFAEDSYDEAWDKVIRGLRRLGERSLHPGEWAEEEGRGGVLLRYLSEHLGDPESAAPPADIEELLLDLVGQIQEPSDRLDLGLCLREIGRRDEGVHELRSAVPHVEDWDRRDLGAQVLAEELFPGFEERFAAAAEKHLSGEGFAEALRFFNELASEIPQFWPAHYFLGRLFSTAEDWAGASESFRVAAGLRRDQPEIWSKLAVAQHEQGKVQEALASMRQALELSPEDPSYYADLALLYFVSGEEEESVRHLGLAFAIDEQNPAVHRAIEQLRLHGLELPEDLIPEGELEGGGEAEAEAEAESGPESEEGLRPE